MALDNISLHLSFFCGCSEKNVPFSWQEVYSHLDIEDITVRGHCSSHARWVLLQGEAYFPWFSEACMQIPFVAFVILILNSYINWTLFLLKGHHHISYLNKTAHFFSEISLPNFFVTVFAVANHYGREPLFSKALIKWKNFSL